MPITKIFKKLEKDKQAFVDNTILNLPIYVENKLRRDMISSIFTQYGKYLIDKGTPINEVYEALHNSLSEFKKLNVQYCNANYETKTMEDVEKYYFKKINVQKQIANTFINKCAPYLKENIENVEDIDVVDDLDKAEESLIFSSVKIDNNTKLMSLVGYYFEECKNRIKNSCDLDPNFSELL